VNITTCLRVDQSINLELRTSVADRPQASRRGTPAPPDPGIVPGGIRERALRAVLSRGPTQEDEAKTRASAAYWRKVRDGAAAIEAAPASA
jgi:hypothetical protein